MAKIVKTKKEKTNKKLAIFSITVFVIVSLLGITSSVVLNTYKVNIMKSIQSTEFRIDDLKLENQRVSMRIQELKNELDQHSSYHEKTEHRYRICDLCRIDAARRQVDALQPGCGSLRGTS